MTLKGAVALQLVTLNFSGFDIDKFEFNCALSFSDLPILISYNVQH